MEGLAIFNKTVTEVLAIGAGIGGVFYSIQGLADIALVLSTFNIVASIATFFKGIEHSKRFKEHDLLRRMVTWVRTSILAAIAILVWYFGLAS